MTMPIHITPSQSDDFALQLEYDFVEILREEADKHEQEAIQLAVAMVRGLRKRYGGERLGSKGLYIPVPSKQERNAAIRAAYNGTNGAQVMREHGIKRTRLYEIVKQRSGGMQIGMPAPKNPLSSHESGRDN